MSRVEHVIDRAKRAASRIAAPIAARAARRYVSGPHLSDALQTARALRARGFATTIGFWNDKGAAPRQVADAQLTAIRDLVGADLDCYVSLKAPALELEPELVREIGARDRLRWLHFDSHGTDAQDATLALAESLSPREGGLGVTLPGRWARSLTDADWAVSRGLRVRVVKGQWAATDGGERDLSSGYLEVVTRLAGRASHVGVASHDPRLAKEALQILVGRGTRAELELLYGLPMTPALAVARSLQVPVRIYVPYGHGWLPYSLGQAVKRPSIAWWMLKDALLDREPVR
jgi:proline dehydrogenase